MLTPEIIAKIKALDLRARYTATDVLAGDYASSFHGRGMEFHEVREYMPGDDVRGIDWNVTARMNQPFVKVFREERELTIMLLIDVSGSMDAGHGKSRREQAAEIASVIAWLTQKSNDRIGLVLFSDHIEHFLPPKKGRGHIWRLIRDVLTWKNTGTRTDSKKVLEHFLRTTKRRSVCFLISDGLLEWDDDLLRRLGRKHDATWIDLHQDPIDGLGRGGVVQLADRETGELMEVDLSNSAWRSSIEAAHSKRDRELAKKLKQSRVSRWKIHPQKSALDQLVAYFKGIVLSSEVSP